MRLNDLYIVKLNRIDNCILRQNIDICYIYKNLKENY